MPTRWPLPPGAEGKREGRRDAFFAEQDLESALRELRKLVDAWLLWQDELERSKAEALSARQRTEALRHELASLRRKMDKEQGIFAELEKEWQHWLAERELQASSSPETVMDLFGFAEQGMELVRRLDWLDRKMRGLEQEIRAYEEECRLVLPDREESGPSTFFRLEAAERAWDEEKKLLRQREIVISRLEPVQEEHIRVNGEIEAVTRSMASLLAEAKAADGEQFCGSGPHRSGAKSWSATSASLRSACSAAGPGNGKKRFAASWTSMTPPPSTKR
ncbi:hypothetical protein VQ056_04335 [Paenibacillus sp. JTLBN-2024]